MGELSELRKYNASLQVYSSAISLNEITNMSVGEATTGCGWCVFDGGESEYSISRHDSFLESGSMRRSVDSWKDFEMGEFYCSSRVAR